MDEQKRVLNIIVGSCAGILVVAIFIFAVTFGINIAIAPLAVALKDVGQLNARVSVLETEIKTLKQGPANRPAPPSEDLTKVHELPVDGSYVLGKADARVTLVEFADFQCPFCARFHPSMMEAYAAFPNDVKVMIKNYPLPFHPHARAAAKAALAAGLQGKYFEMVSALVAAGSELSDAKYKELAGKLGLDVEQFTRDLKDKDAAFEKQVDADLALTEKADVRGTPTYFINGRKTMARTADAFKKEIEALLKK